MALLQKSYIFNSSCVDQIFSRCDSSVFEQFEMDLYHTALESLPYSEKLKDYLIFLRYDRENWLTINPEYYQLDKWFLICLGRYCKENWNLSKEEPYSYFLVSEILSLNGWTKDKIGTLILGNHLTSLTTLSRYQFASQMRFLKYGCGWLGMHELESYRNDITSLRDVFYQPDAKILSLLDNYECTYDKKRQIIKKSYDDLLKMIFFKNPKMDSLFLILD